MGSSKRPGLTDLALVWIFKAHVWGEGRPYWDLSTSWPEQLCYAICPHHNVLPKVNGDRTMN